MHLLNYFSDQDQTRHIVVIVEDITLEYQQGQKIFHMAYTDSLTGLMNRTALLDRIDQTLCDPDQNRIKLFLIDYDNFRDINNTFGYHFGDQVLKSIAQLMELHQLPELRFIAHISSNRFAFCTSETFPNQSFLDWVRDNLWTVTVEGINLKINFSVGVSVANMLHSGQKADVLLKNAEIAMYSAKDSGRNMLTEYTLNNASQLERRTQISSQFEAAMERQEFHLVFQPKVINKSRQIIGFEALVRWQSSELGFVSPAEFIPLAEKSGNIIRLGEEILQQAFAFAREINRDRPAQSLLVVSVNLSVIQLLAADFIDRFFAILRQEKVSPRMIAIEITESALITNLAMINERLGAFRDQGIRVYLDDFGTGYSSLSYISNLQIDVIKIDKSFIDAIENASRELEIVRFILDLAKLLQMEVIAEGVETKGQYQLLTDQGCQMSQGYYFSKPVVPELAIQMIEKEGLF